MTFHLGLRTVRKLDCCGLRGIRGWSCTGTSFLRALCFSPVLFHQCSIHVFHSSYTDVMESWQLNVSLSQGRIDTCQHAGQANNLATLTIEFLKLFRPRTGLANFVEGAGPNCGFGDFFRVRKPEFTSTICASTIICDYYSDILACHVYLRPGYLPGWGAP